MAKQGESKISGNIVKALNKLPKTWARKVVMGIHQKGIPDIACVSHGKAFWLETKVPGKEGEATEHQINTMKLIEAAGGLCEVVVSVEEAVAFVKENT